jgi:DNA end-binding protein Ku
VRAYDLLLDAMRKTGYAAIAKVTMFGRENIVIIRALESGFTLHTMFYENEVRAAGEKPKKSELKDAESKLAMQLIDTLAAPFEPSQYVDSYRQELERLIEAKRSGKKLAVMPRVKRENVVDLMSALKTSLSRESSKRDLLRTVAKPNKEQKKSRAS